MRRLAFPIAFPTKRVIYDTDQSQSRSRLRSACCFDPV